MTYKYYLAKYKKHDDLKTYKEYLERFHDIYKMMNPEMKQQHAENTYGMRFAIQIK